MKDSLLELIAATKHVVACWTVGDLAAAVNNLERLALEAEVELERAAVLPAGGAKPVTAYWLTTDVENSGTDTSVFFTRDERDQAFIDWMREQAKAEPHYGQSNPAGLNFAAGISAPVIAECLDELYAEFQTLRPDAMAWTGEQPCTAVLPAPSPSPLVEPGERAGVRGALNDYWLLIHSHRHGQNNYLFGHKPTQEEAITFLGDCWEPDRDESISIEPIDLESSGACPDVRPVPGGAELPLRLLSECPDLPDDFHVGSPDGIESFRQGFLRWQARVADALLIPSAGSADGVLVATSIIPRVVVIVSGGVVDQVLCSDATTRVEILDHDNADTPEARNTLCLQEAEAQAELHSVPLH